MVHKNIDITLTLYRPDAEISYNLYYTRFT